LHRFWVDWLRCKVVQLNIQIFQGSAAADLRRGGRFYYSFLQFLCECKSERIIKNLKTIHICQGYSKNKMALFSFYGIYGPW